MFRSSREISWIWVLGLIITIYLRHYQPRHDEWLHIQTGRRRYVHACLWCVQAQSAAFSHWWWWLLVGLFDFYATWIDIDKTKATQGQSRQQLSKLHQLQVYRKVWPLNKDSCRRGQVKHEHHIWPSKNYLGLGPTHLRCNITGCYCDNGQTRANRLERWPGRPVRVSACNVTTQMSWPISAK